MADNGDDQPAQQGDQQGDQPQAGQRQVRLRVDERDMITRYANAFRTNSTTDEVMLDFGVNLPSPPPQGQDTPEMLFKLDARVVMNYYSAKRLALTLTQLIRRHEDQFGELQLDVAKRRRNGL